MEYVLLNGFVEFGANLKRGALVSDPSIANDLAEFEGRFNPDFLAFQFWDVATQARLVIANAFEAYYESYVKDSLHLSDPIIGLCETRKAPFEWHSVFSCRDVPAVFKTQSLSAANKVLTVPTGGKGLVAALHIGCSAETWKEKASDIVWFGSILAANVCKKVLERQNGESQAMSLDEPQAECLTLLAAGKDVEEIARLTRRSRKSVSRNIAEAMVKLHASNQPHAIVTAMTLGSI